MSDNDNLFTDAEALPPEHAYPGGTADVAVLPTPGAPVSERLVVGAGPGGGKTSTLMYLVQLRFASRDAIHITYWNRCGCGCGAVSPLVCEREPLFA